MTHEKGKNKSQETKNMQQNKSVRKGWRTPKKQEGWKKGQPNKRRDKNDGDRVGHCAFEQEGIQSIPSIQSIQSIQTIQSIQSITKYNKV